MTVYGGSESQVGQGEQGSPLAEVSSIEVVLLHRHARPGIAFTDVKQFAACHDSIAVALEKFFQGHFR